MIGAELKKGETEFYWDGPDGFGLRSGSATELTEIPAHEAAIIDARMNAKHHQGLNYLGIFQEDERRVKFLKCNNSAYDFTPDIVDGKLNLEYVACPERGKCKAEGSLCQPLEINGTRITMAQLKIISLIRQCRSDKEICHELGIKPQTLRTHKQTIQIKLNADRKVQVALKAVEYGII